MAARSQRTSHASRASTRLREVAAAKGMVMALPSIRPMLRVYLANIKALRHYLPQPYSHRITLFRVGHPSHTDPYDQTRGWSELAPGKVVVHQMPGDHISVMRRPHVQVLANALAACFASD